MQRKTIANQQEKPQRGAAFEAVLRLAVLLPIVFALAVGVSSRTAPDTFAFEAYNAAQNQQAQAYAGIVRESAKIPLDPIDANPRTVRRVASDWVGGAKSGKLQTLTQISFDDTIDNGAKRDIFAANQRAVSAVNALANRDIAAGNWDLSVKDALLAIRTASVVRPFDYLSVWRDDQLMDISLSRLRDSFPHTSGPVRDAADHVLFQTPISSSALAEIAIRARDLDMLQEAYGAQGPTYAFVLARNLPLATFRDVNLGREATSLRISREQDPNFDQAMFLGWLATDCSSAQKIVDQVSTLRRQIGA